MALKSAAVFVAFLLFLAVCNVPIRGRDVAKPAHTLTIVQGENSSANVSSRAQTNDVQYTHRAGYLAQGEWHGVGAKLNLWGLPGVQPKSYSGAYIAVRSRGEFIAAGFHVYPSLYRNNDMRFFTNWAATSNGKPTAGCYNAECKGFVVARETNLFPGEAFAPPFSQYQGEQRYFQIRIKKDETTGDWSLYREDKGGPIGGMTLIGWWPNTLFEDLQHMTTQIEWKGEVSYSADEISPPMGSGHYAEQYEGRAAYFKNIVAFSTDQGLPIYPGNSMVSVDFDRYRPICYDVSHWFKNKRGNDGYHFFYGGPSGCSDRD